MKKMLWVCDVCGDESACDGRPVGWNTVDITLRGFRNAVLGDYSAMPRELDACASCQMKIREAVDAVLDGRTVIVTGAAIRLRQPDGSVTTVDLAKPQIIVAETVKPNSIVIEPVDAVEEIRGEIAFIDGGVEAFAARAGVSAQYILDILRGALKPPPRVLDAAGLQEVSYIIRNHSNIRVPLGDDGNNPGGLAGILNAMAKEKRK